MPKHWVPEFWKDRSAPGFRRFAARQAGRSAVAVLGVAIAVPSLFEFLGLSDAYERTVAPVWPLAVYLLVASAALHWLYAVLVRWPTVSRALKQQEGARLVSQIRQSELDSPLPQTQEQSRDDR
jgi:protein-S-isoprenylcysteine O-methyltransferase Ste14